MRVWTAGSTYSKSNEESWDGQGLDPRFDGTWKLSKLYIATVCNGILQTGQIATSGSFKRTVSGASYQEEQQGFAFGSSDACTGTATGDLEASVLTVTAKQKTASTDCIKEKTSSESIAGIDRSFVYGSKIIDLQSFTDTDSECSNNTRTTTYIVIEEKQ